MNMLIDPWIPLTTANGRSWHSLRETLEYPDNDVTISHPMAYLDTPIFMQVCALVQFLADNKGGLSEAAWEAVLLDGKEPDTAWLFDGVEKIRGFDLFEETAYLQIPASMLHAGNKPKDDKPEPVFGLFQPIRSRRGEDASSKSLRAPTRQIRQICPACAGAGLFITQHFAGATANFSGTSPVRGALVFLLEPKGTLGQRIYANALSCENPHWKSLQTPLPWVPDKSGFNGNNADGTLPFEPYLAEEGCLRGSANLHLPVIRGVRLCEPLAQTGQCDCCGQTGALINSFFLKGEDAIFKALSPEIRETVKKNLPDKKPGTKVLYRILDPVAYHPFLAYMEVKGKAAEQSGYKPVGHQQTLEKARTMQPAWVTLGKIVSGGEYLEPAQIAQFHAIRDEIPEEGATCLRLFAVNFEGAMNSTPKTVINERYGIALLRVFLKNPRYADDLVKRLAQTVRTHINAWIEGVKILHYSVNREDEKLELKPPGKLKELDETINKSGVIRSHARRLWNHALVKVMGILADDNLEKAYDDLLNEAITSLHKEGGGLWRECRRIVFESNPGIKELFLEARAGSQYRDTIRNGGKNRQRKNKGKNMNTAAYKPGHINEVRDVHIRAARKFKHKFEELPKSKRASLRQADREERTGTAPFWICFNAAKELYEQAGIYTAHHDGLIKLYAGVTPLLETLYRENGGRDIVKRNFGDFLHDCHYKQNGEKKVALRRVEALLTAKDLEELLENIESVLSIVKQGPKKPCFDLLLYDLYRFQYDANKIRREWAEAFFSNVHHQE
ncbi:MAG: type I-E CRISPR-associated protein Cse1/CasA [Gammaproteobacteria bacterium]|nr:type I-E CRISPR-associated protein Cse1/CasA [Gammaproteobacteria bacterium]